MRIASSGCPLLFCSAVLFPGYRRKSAERYSHSNLSPSLRPLPWLSYRRTKSSTAAALTDPTHPLPRSLFPFPNPHKPLPFHPVNPLSIALQKTWPSDERRVCAITATTSGAHPTSVAVESSFSSWNPTTHPTLPYPQPSTLTLLPQTPLNLPLMTPPPTLASTPFLG